jgi:hypothetical protein
MLGRFVNTNLERVWKRAAVVSPGVLSHDMPGSSEESHEKSQSRKPVAELRQTENLSMQSRVLIITS